MPQIIDLYYADQVSGLKYQLIINCRNWVDIIRLNVSANNYCLLCEHDTWFIIYNGSGSVAHREDGPAHIIFDEHGKYKYQEWCYKGQVINHSADGDTQQDFERYLKTLCLR